MTPFEAWTEEKPSVGHLHKFGCNVWILDESKKQIKVIPEIKQDEIHQILDGLKLIHYYNAATRSIKVSQNFAFNEDDDFNELEIYTDLPDLVDIEGEDTPSDDSTNADKINPTTTTEIPTTKKPSTTENPSTNTAATPTM